MKQRLETAGAAWWAGEAANLPVCVYSSLTLNDCVSGGDHSLAAMMDHMLYLL